MTATQPDSERMVSRRGVMRATAVGIGAAAGMGAVGSTASTVRAVDWGDVGTIAASTAVGGPIGLGWALRETEVLGSNPPAEGLTADALKQDVYQTARTRRSFEQSSILSGENLASALEDTAYTDAKTAAIEELNAGSDESTIVAAANDAIDGYETTVQKNILNTWNESVLEFGTLVAALNSHPDTSDTDAFGTPGADTFDGTWYGLAPDEYSSGTYTQDKVYTLADGTDFEMAGYGWEHMNAGRVLTNPVNGTSDTEISAGPTASYDGQSVSWMHPGEYNTVLNSVESTFQNVRDGISTWVTNVYSDVQSGEIEISELTTPRERAAMMSDDETKAQAIADLAALNIPVDSEREATISITETGATITGTLGLSDESDGPIEVGTTYDPSTLSGDVYITADVSQITGEWTEYESGIDGGTITLSAEPYDGVTYEVTTAAGETVSVPSSDWNADGSGSWTYDASGDLETTITEVDSIEYSSSDTESQIETLRLTREFTVESLTNQETGEEETTASFESSEPQTDSNYISQEEWDQLEQQNEDLIEKYEESQNDGGGGAGAGFFGDGGPSTGVLAAGVGAVGVVYALFGQGDS